VYADRKWIGNKGETEMKKYTNSEIISALELLAYVCENISCGDCPLKYDDGDCFEDYRCSLGDPDWMKEVAERLKGR
jgi:hypothetical protein